MRQKKLPSQRLLERLLEYNPDTGVLFWKPRPEWMFMAQDTGLRRCRAATWNTKFSGREAGWNATNGYVLTTLWKNKFPAHRLIWKLVHGIEPDTIDHINGIRSDNRIANLRNVTFAENRLNLRLRKTNSSGTSGVSWHSKRRQWRARISVRKKVYHLGWFRNKSDAVAARKEAEQKLDFSPKSIQPRL